MRQRQTPRGVERRSRHWLSNHHKASLDKVRLCTTHHAEPVPFLNDDHDHDLGRGSYIPKHTSTFSTTMAQKNKPLPAAPSTRLGSRYPTRSSSNPGGHTRLALDIPRDINSEAASITAVAPSHVFSGFPGVRMRAARFLQRLLGPNKRFVGGIDGRVRGNKSGKGTSTGMLKLLGRKGRKSEAQVIAERYRSQ
ncbi:hypothetical protein CYLTODRAFT_371294 [Cylindrobasidium torrendii FP15055 ss-10]|uniref:Uncharacterized protein n=1 Tax=Cylindrobasidium torrendii FP15055 ss-10 TaxID=1314674 RepID=A0A0D7BKT2_9AGAR|nr:hypothetical protein CYLTODRAFT_371294 [Cylindrobasidium torrendii FP15055 ss-10]